MSSKDVKITKSKKQQSTKKPAPVVQPEKQKKRGGQSDDDDDDDDYDFEDYMSTDDGSSSNSSDDDDDASSTTSSDNAAIIAYLNAQRSSSSKPTTKKEIIVAGEDKQQLTNLLYGNTQKEKTRSSDISVTNKKTPTTKSKSVIINDKPEEDPKGKSADATTKAVLPSLLMALSLSAALGGKKNAMATTIKAVSASKSDNSDSSDSDFDDDDDMSHLSNAFDETLSVSTVSDIEDLEDMADITINDIMDKVEIPEENRNKNISNELVHNKIKDTFMAYPKNAILKKCLVLCEKEMQQEEAKRAKREKKQTAHYKKVYKKMMYAEDTNPSDYKYFKRASLEEKRRIITETRAINAVTKVEKPYRVLLIDANIPMSIKAHALKKIIALESTEPGYGEYGKLKPWVDNFMRIPFNCHSTLPVSITDPPERITEFIVNAKKTLDDTVYGMDDAKMQIMQMIGQLITNPASVGSAIGICGPPGVGKTSCIKDGVSKILGRPFYMITLGGATDSSFLEGHSYTYEGAVWGRIVQILLECGRMDPIIYFGELDKVSQTPKGDEIIGILMHLIDVTQNMCFHDKYFADIDFDMSKALFIFDYNDESLIHPILRDRLYKIYAKGYDMSAKKVIAMRYMLPKICQEMRFGADEVVIPETTIAYIIETHCVEERDKGVRNLKRALETIYRKLNLIRLLGATACDVFNKDLKLDKQDKITFPCTVTPQLVNKLLVRPENSCAHLLMYT